jgi:hypothetical protein
MGGSWGHGVDARFFVHDGAAFQFILVNAHVVTGERTVGPGLDPRR